MARWEYDMVGCVVLCWEAQKPLAVQGFEFILAIELPIPRDWVKINPSCELW